MGLLGTPSICTFLNTRIHVQMTCPKINTGVSTMPIQYQPGPLSCTNIAFLTACPTTLRWTARPKPVKEPSFRRTGTITMAIGSLLFNCRVLPLQYEDLMTKPPSQPTGHGASSNRTSPWQPQIDPLIIELMNKSGQASARGVACTTTSSPTWREGVESDDNPLSRM